MIRKRTFTMAMTLAILAYSPLASEPNREKGPCAEEIQALCPDAKGPKERRKCMQENKDKLSEQCKARIGEMKEKAKAMKEACKEDVESFCSDVKPGKGRIMKCLKENIDQVSAQCREALPPGMTK